MADAIAGAPKEAAESVVKIVRPKFAEVTANEITVNGKLTMIIFVSDGKAEEEGRKIEFELTAADGKSSNATLTYTQPAVPEKK